MTDTDEIYQIHLWSDVMLFLSFLIAVLPILWLVIALSLLKMPGHKACLIAMLLTMVLGLLYWKLPLLNVASAALEGILNALWPICLVIIAALFTYNLTLHTGAMEAIKGMLAGVSSDKRVLALLIGWGFGNFMEGMAGFGTAVAIPASILCAIGLDPFAAVIGCLVVNSTPTAFGSVGVPTVTLSAITGCEVLGLSADITVLQMLLTFLSPFFLVLICGGGLRALKGMLSFTFISSISFILPWYLSAKALGPELPDMIGAVCSMACMILGIRFLLKKEDPSYAIVQKKSEISAMNPFRAWSSFILIFVLLMGTSKLCPPINQMISGIKTSISVYNGENPAVLTFSWINTPGVIIFIAGIIGGLIQGAKPGEILKVLMTTLKRYYKTIITICSVMATAKIMGYAGMISAIAAFLVAVTGSLYPLSAPLIGAVGGFVTGSGTSTCVLFGGLQSQTAISLGLDPSWLAAANVCGAGIGKMISPQGIAIGTGAIGCVGEESKILRSVFKYFVLYVLVAGIICFVGTLL